MKNRHCLLPTLFLAISAFACRLLGSPAPFGGDPRSGLQHRRTASHGHAGACGNLDPLPTSVLLPSAGEGIGAVVAGDEIRWYRTLTDTLESSGLVSNPGREDVKSLEGVVILLDDSSRPVATASGFAELGFLCPGETSPFRATISDLPPAWQDYQILLQRARSECVERCRDFEILPSTLESSDSNTNQINGELKNTGSEI